MHKAGKDMTDLKETRAARGLQYSVNRMVRSLDKMLDKLQAKEKKLQAAQTSRFDAKRRWAPVPRGGAVPILEVDWSRGILVRLRTEKLLAATVSD